MEKSKILKPSWKSSIAIHESIESGIHESIDIFSQRINPANLRPLGETSLQNPRGSVFAISPSTQLQLGYENP